MTTIIHKQKNFSSGKELYITMSVDKDGQQGIVGNPMPLVSLQKEVTALFLEEIKDLKEHTNQEIRIVKFSNPEILYSTNSN